MVEEKTRLMLACETGDEEAVERIIEELGDTLSDHINRVERWGRTALVYAIENKHVGIALSLIDHGANLDFQYAVLDDMTPLMIAVENGIEVVVERILKELGDSLSDHLSRVDFFGTTALGIAIQKKHVGIALSLIDHGADVKMCCGTGETPLMEAACYELDVIVKRILKELGDSLSDHINCVDRRGRTALVYAIENKHVGIALSLIDHGADVMISSRGDGQTPLMIAAYRGLDVVVKRILKELGDSSYDHINRVDPWYSWGRTALGIAIENKHVGIALSLIDHGADVMISSRGDGQTPLMIAAYRGLDVVVKRILKELGDSLSDHLSRVDRWGRTALGHAIRDKHVGIALSLIDHGADVKMPCSGNRRTPVMIAAQGGIDVIVVERILKELGNSSYDHINRVDRRRRSALVYACSKRHVDIAKILINHGADPRNIIVNDDYRDIQSILKEATNEPHRVDVLERVRWLHDTGKRTVHVEINRCPNKNPLLTNVVEKVLSLNDDVFGDLREMMTPWWVVECT